MRRIVVNRCYGGFQLSAVAKAMYNELRAAKNNNNEDTNKDIAFDVRRDDPILLFVVDAIGLDACSVADRSRLRIVKIPDDVPTDGWDIQNCYGMEWVSEKHRVWCASHQK
jgi:hypothetical protein